MFIFKLGGLADSLRGIVVGTLFLATVLDDRGLFGISWGDDIGEEVVEEAIATEELLEDLVPEEMAGLWLSKLDLGPIVSGAPCGCWRAVGG